MGMRERGAGESERRSAAGELPGAWIGGRVARECADNRGRRRIDERIEAAAGDRDELPERYFDDTFTESLAESLMKAPAGGAVGVWASSGLTEAAGQRVMNLEIFSQLFSYDQTIGEAITKAKASVTDRDVRRTWILFGDPTMRLGY